MKQTINTGTAANSKTGDSLRDAFTKVNNNFNELYTFIAQDTQIPVQAGNAGKVLKTTGSSLLFDSMSYLELTNRPALFTGSYNDLTDKPMLFSGNYGDLTNRPNVITLEVLQSIVATSTDFTDFKAKIAAL